MASTSLYPPTVEPTAAAFVASETAKCRLYFSLSRFSSSTDNISSIHISIVKQSTGQNVVNKIDDLDKKRFRRTGIIIIDTPPVAISGVKNLYYVDIENDDIKIGDKVGWEAGLIYKIQIRLSTIKYEDENGEIPSTPAVWLSKNASKFTEWTTYCTTKAIEEPKISIPMMKGFKSSEEQKSPNKDKLYSLSLTTLDFNGSYNMEYDISETLYSYTLKLYDEAGSLVEDSGVIYANQYYDPNQFHYLFKHEFEDEQEYLIKFEFTTINKYTTIYDFNIYIEHLQLEETIINAISIENIDTIDNKDFVENFKKSTSLVKENEEGRIGIKLFSTNHNRFSGNVCLRRADSKDGFTTWTDIKIVPCVDTVINNLPMIYDNTIESGVWYKYGVQLINTLGDRGILNQSFTTMLRDFEYSFLNGENGKQLKLMLNNTMNSYSYNFSESKIDTIGGKYPYITRNGNMKYRTFQVNGLISCIMDENNLFVNDKEMYATDAIHESYKQYRKKYDIVQYDYKKEYDFRTKVFEFLQDGKPKLFRSPTEGNIIVRLMQVAGQPQQSINRIIYSFTSNAFEVAEATMDNYLKYGFYEVGDYLTSFETRVQKLGQIEMDFKPGDNIIEKIWQKYDNSNQNFSGVKMSLSEIRNLSIEFDDKLFIVNNNANQKVLGNNIRYNSNIITIGANNGRVYHFDENISFRKEDVVEILGGIDDDPKTTIHATINFIREQVEDVYNNKKIDSTISEKGFGQLLGNYKPDSDLYNEIYYKFYYEWGNEFRKLSKLSICAIEANPGAVFLIEDMVDDSAIPKEQLYHEIGPTGILSLNDIELIKGLKYVGMRKPDGTIDTQQSCDMMIDYIYYTLKGIYNGGV